MTVSPLVGPVAAPELHVMTFNIRRPVRNLKPRSPDRWAYREPLVRRLLAAERPTIVGIQEAMPEQYDAVRVGLGPGYDYVGRGRKADGTGESCPLFYDTERLKLLDSEQFALSETPHTPGSSSWGNMVPRILISANFRDIVTGTRFVAINTHWDHMSRTSRLLSANMVRNLAGTDSLPVVVLGDFNTDAGTKPYEALTRGGVLLDAWETAEDRLSPRWGTFPRYREPELGRKRIDWVLATPSVSVLRTGINTTTYDGGWPSDHAPVQAVLRFDSPAGLDETAGTAGAEK
ncbi:endonuclease/exonuclease/phosphatase family protein [Arthrobacter roseus]|uniref:endonuclease/exonuclease/phosphatase family protein n=1 Tax=Arthrobacter roseus TaxID=136274 RepID=UPI0019650C22|nr:endonuclease/exonuclease/phosphatase family protein [Arthrobacter roseus]MBM7846850.1 endonuclease/exonuclease/phosphatase family metal-dependent hydrolase [Arthrobacter roseus]